MYTSQKAGSKVNGILQIMEQSEVLKNRRDRGSCSCQAQVSPGLSFCLLMPCVWQFESRLVIHHFLQGPMKRGMDSDAARQILV